MYTPQTPPSPTNHVAREFSQQEYKLLVVENASLHQKIAEANAFAQTRRAFHVHYNRESVADTAALIRRLNDEIVHVSSSIREALVNAQWPRRREPQHDRFEHAHTRAVNIVGRPMMEIVVSAILEEHRNWDTLCDIVIQGALVRFVHGNGMVL
jgi:hypothetical protein